MGEKRVVEECGKSLYKKSIESMVAGEVGGNAVVYSGRDLGRICVAEVRKVFKS